MFPIALPAAAPAALLRASPAARTVGHLWFGYAFSIVQACSARRSCHHGLLARQAFLQYGRGRHPARLNFGDCFPYALAKVRRDTFLSKAKTSQGPTSFPPGNPDPCPISPISIPVSPPIGSIPQSGKSSPAPA